jgi:hypothetical protein
MTTVFAAIGFASPLRAADEPPKPSAPVPDGYKLVYAQSFDDADSAKSIHPTDPNAWRFNAEGKGSGAIELHQQSKYKYKVRSPLNIALVDGLVVGDFVLEADLTQTGKEYGHRDMCLFFGFKDRSHFYYVHMATKADPNAHNVFLVNDKPRTNIAKKTTEGVDWGKNEWQHVRLERDTKAGTIKVFWNDMKEPIMVAQDKTFGEGYIGFGSFDDTGKVDNIRVWSPSAKREKLGDVFAEGRE